jgi:hypothetical protein
MNETPLKANEQAAIEHFRLVAAYLRATGVRVTPRSLRSVTLSDAALRAALKMARDWRRAEKVED